MKRNIVIFFLLLSTFCFGQVTLRFGGSGGAASGSAGAYYNIKSYGAQASVVSIQEFRVATSGNKINATAGIQAAINAAHTAGGGIVYIPPGHYYTNQLETYANVTILGDGFMSSFLHALSDTTMSMHNLPAANVGGFGSSLTNNDIVRGVRFQGDSVGKVGLYIDRAANFLIRECYFEFYLTTAMMLPNSLIGTVADCRFYYNTNGVKGYSNRTDNTASNHVKFEGCVINLNKKWALEWSDGGSLIVSFCDFEGNGSVYDTTTGAIYYHNNRWTNGVTIVYSWFEENVGNDVWIGPQDLLNNFNHPTVNTNYMAANNIQGHHYNFTNRNIYVSGSNNKLIISGGNLYGAMNGNNIVVDGTNNKVYTDKLTYAAENPTGANNVVRGTGNSITNN